MPELPEVETVRRMLESTVRGRTIRRLERSRHKLHVSAAGTKRGIDVRGRTIEAVDRHGKFLLIRLSGGVTVISHLGMSGQWRFFPDSPPPRLPHVHVRIAFDDGTRLWFQDPRRFGMFRAIPTTNVGDDASVRMLGPDPIANPPTGASLAALARGVRVNVKNFLLDQRRIAGIGNIYASEILHRAGVHPARIAGTLGLDEWRKVARETRVVLRAAIERMGTTFSTYRTLWNEPGAYADRLLVYDRAGAPCRTCGTPIRRIVQGQRSTFYCTTCQRMRRTASNSS